MPVLKCNNCGGITNTAVSEFDFRDVDKGAHRCYAKYEDGKWVEGCAYEDSHKLYFDMAKLLIEGGKQHVS